MLTGSPDIFTFNKTCWSCDASVKDDPTHGILIEVNDCDNNVKGGDSVTIVDIVTPLESTTVKLKLMFAETSAMFVRYAYKFNI